MTATGDPTRIPGPGARAPNPVPEAGECDAFRLLMDAAPLGVLVHRAYHPLYLNPAWAVAHGTTVDEVLSTASVLGYMGEAYRRRVLRRGVPQEPGGLEHQTYQVNRAGGVSIELEEHARPVQWHGEPAVLAMVVEGRRPGAEPAVTDNARVAAEASEALLRSTLDHAPAVIFFKDIHGCFRLVNQRFLDVYGLREDAVIGHRCDELFDAANATVFACADAQIKSSRGPVEYTFTHQDVSGELRNRSVVKFPVFDTDGALMGIGGVDLDVTERERAQNALRESERTLKTLISNLPGMAYKLDRTQGAEPHDFMSIAWQRLTGYDLEHWKLHGAQTLRRITHCEDRARITDEVEKALALHQPFELRYRVIHADGDIRWFWEQGRGVYEEGRLVSVEGFVSDVTQSHTLSLELELQATHDPLTGLPNRRAFERRLHTLVEQVNQAGVSGAVAYLDLDRFKMVNDTCGHGAGDALLRQLASSLLTGIDEHVLLARLGGDEFGLLIEACTMEQAWMVCENVRKLVQNFRFGWEGQSYSLGCSVGLVSLVAPCATPEDLMIAADNACYRAKDEGRDRIHMLNFEDANDVGRSDEARSLALVRGALAKQRMRLYRQPIAGAAVPDDGRERFELLLRIEDDVGGIHAPERYLSVAQRHGLSGRIDRATVSTALAWLSRGPASAQPAVALCSINLSAYSMIDPGFLRFVMNELDASGVSGELLCFELTETAVVSNLAEARSFMDVLRARGCRFALDDFGTGVSSFAYLKALPVDIIKIDGMFVRDVIDDPINLELVRAINAIAHAMGKQTVAEFVETDAIRQCMAEVGVDFVQGYAIGRPEPLPME